MTALSDYTADDLASPVTYRAASQEWNEKMRVAAAQFNSGIQNAIASMNAILAANLVVDEFGQPVLDGSNNPTFTPLNVAIGTEDPTLFAKYRTELESAANGPLAQMNAVAQQLLSIFPAA